MLIKRCPICGKELFAVPDSKSTKGNSIVAQLHCKEHGIQFFGEMLFEQALLYYQKLK